MFCFGLCIMPYLFKKGNLQAKYNKTTNMGMYQVLCDIIYIGRPISQTHMNQTCRILQFKRTFLIYNTALRLFGSIYANIIVWRKQSDFF